MSIHRPSVLTTGLIAMTLLSSHAPGFTLVHDGKPAATIVVSRQTEFDRYKVERPRWIEQQLREDMPDLDDAAFKRALSEAMKPFNAEVKATGDEELLAAEELQQIVKRISGAELPIVRVDGSEIPNGPVILLGSELARQAGLGDRLEPLHRDGFLCAAGDDRLVLSGRRARGTLYAVYHLLESLGCRWVMPGPFGEIYPQQATLTTRIDEVQNPSHDERYWWCTYGQAADYPRWTLRNKGNFVRAMGDPVIGQGHYLGRPLQWGATQEKYRVKLPRPVRKKVDGPDGQPQWVWEEQETWTLPDEYYALIQGKLNFHTANFSNPKVWDLYAEHYIDLLNRNPAMRYASMSAEDGLVLDERLDSQRLRSHEYDLPMGAPSATDPLWFFLNRIINRVEKVHPDRRFGVLVYSNNMAPPRIESVHPKMALIFAPLGICPLHHVRDEKCKTNRLYHQWLEDWMLQARTAGADTYYYDYEPLGFCWNMAMICPRWGIIGRNYPYFHDLGLDGHTTQGHDDWASSGLNNYLMIRLYWDVKQDYRAVIADYCRARFGAAAPAMQRYYQALEDRMAQVPDLYSNENWGNHLVLTPEVRRRSREILAEATAAADTETARAHVRTMVDVQASTDAMCDAVELANATGDFAGAARTMETVFAVRDRLNRLYPNFMQSRRLDETQKVEYLTGGIYQQFLAFDKRIKSASASLVLPRQWKGMVDTRQHAAMRGLHKPGADVAGLDDLDVTIHPDVQYGTQREVAAFFYRTTVAVPQEFAGRPRITLYFPALIARTLQIWINGRPVEFDLGEYRDTVWRGPERFWISYNHEQEFDVTPYIEPGKDNVIAMRVFKSFDIGGPYRRIFLLGQ